MNRIVAIIYEHPKIIIAENIEFILFALLHCMKNKIILLCTKLALLQLWFLSKQEYMSMTLKSKCYYFL